MFDYQSFVDMMMHVPAGNGKPYHLLSQIIGPFMLLKQTKVAVYQGIHKKTISQYPLFIPPVAGGLLCNQGAGGGALILHPGECFFDCFLKKFHLHL